MQPAGWLPPVSHFQTQLCSSTDGPDHNCAKPAWIWFGSGWLCQVLAKWIWKQTGVQESKGPFLANASELIWIRSGMFTGLQSCGSGFVCLRDVHIYPLQQQQQQQERKKKKKYKKALLGKNSMEILPTLGITQAVSLVSFVWVVPVYLCVHNFVCSYSHCFIFCLFLWAHLMEWPQVG